MSSSKGVMVPDYDKLLKKAISDAEQLLGPRELYEIRPVIFRSVSYAETIEDDLARTLTVYLAECAKNSITEASRDCPRLPLASS